MNIITIIIILIVAAAVIFGGIAVAKKMKKGGGCCGEHEGTVKKTNINDRNKKNYPYKATLIIGGMTCDNCSRKVENALNEIPGTWAKVDISSKRANVLMKEKIDENLLRQAVSKAGYVVTGIE